MKRKFILINTILFVLIVVTTTSSKDFFSGVWCIGDERLIIAFTGEDSLHVSSQKDETLKGSGTYERKDSTLIATLKNDDLELKMGYRYKRRSNSSIRAKIIFFTVDGDSVSHPRRWMRMERCNPDTLSAEEDEDKKKDKEEKEEKKQR